VSPVSAALFRAALLRRSGGPDGSSAALRMPKFSLEAHFVFQKGDVINEQIGV